MIERLYGKRKTGAYSFQAEIIEAEFPPEKEQVEDSVQFAQTAVSAGMKPAGAAMN